MTTVKGIDTEISDPENEGEYTCYFKILDPSRFFMPGELFIGDHDIR